MSDGKWRIEATIPTGPYANVHVGGDDWAEMDDVLSDPLMDGVLDKLRLLAGAEVVKRAVPGTQEVYPDGRGDEPATASRGQSTYGRRKQAAAANEGGDDAGPQRCRHGDMRFYDSGTWRAWFCPLGKENPQACQPRDGRTGEEWAPR